MHVFAYAHAAQVRINGHLLHSRKSVAQRAALSVQVCSRVTKQETLLVAAGCTVCVMIDDIQDMQRNLRELLQAVGGGPVGGGLFTSGLAISARKAASAAHAPFASPTAGRGDRVVVHALIGGHQLVGVAAADLHMLAYQAPLGRALVVTARMFIAFHHLLPVLTPPVMQS